MGIVGFQFRQKLARRLGAIAREQAAVPRLRYGASRGRDRLSGTAREMVGAYRTRILSMSGDRLEPSGICNASNGTYHSIPSRHDNEFFEAFPRFCWSVRRQILQHASAAVFFPRITGQVLQSMG